MKSKLYSYALVGVQFISIISLVMQGSSIFTHPFPLAVFCTGAGVGVYAIWHNQTHNFNIIPEIKENAELITTGAYAYVRHPMYFSVLLMMLGFLCAAPSTLNITVYGLLVGVLFLKARKEEKLWLKKCEEYHAYKVKTKSIIPFVL
jgi:protein-S-isoprenylcysteine O-methyltransferase Ste14